MLMEQKKLEGELGEKTAAFCHKYNDIMVNNIGAACGGAIGELSQDVAKAAAKMQQPGISSQASALHKDTEIHCASIGSHKDKDGKSTKTAQEVCEAARAGDIALQSRLTALTYESGPLDGDKAKLTGWKLICASVGGSQLHSRYCKKPEEVIVDGKKSAIIVDNCPAVERSIEAAYRPNSKIQSSISSTPPSSITTGSFCSASNNSGRYNPKDSMGGQGQNRLGQQGNATNSQ